MSLSLNTPYRILFPSKATPDEVTVFVTDDAGIPADHFILELEVSEDAAVRKCRLQGNDANAFSLCSDGASCLNGTPGALLRLIDAAIDEADGDIAATMKVISSQPIPHGQEYIIPITDDTLQVTLFMTLIDAGAPVMPCEDDQPEAADSVDDPERKTVGAWPMLFDFPGVWEGGPTGPGKKVRVIWKKDL